MVIFFKLRDKTHKYVYKVQYISGNDLLVLKLLLYAQDLSLVIFSYTKCKKPSVVIIYTNEFSVQASVQARLFWMERNVNLTGLNTNGLQQASSSQSFGTLDS